MVRGSGIADARGTRAHATVGVERAGPATRAAAEAVGVRRVAIGRRAEVARTAGEAARGAHCFERPARALEPAGPFVPGPARRHARVTRTAPAVTVRRTQVVIQATAFALVGVPGRQTLPREIDAAAQIGSVALLAALRLGDAVAAMVRWADRRRRGARSCGGCGGSAAGGASPVGGPASRGQQASDPLATTLPRFVAASTTPRAARAAVGGGSGLTSSGTDEWHAGQAAGFPTGTQY